jgi:cell division protein FtsN
MTRDYAKRNVSRRKPKKKISYLGLWIFVLCLFAAFIVSLVYLGKHNQHVRPTIKIISSQPAIETPVKEIAAPKFDFYTILQQKKNSNTISEYELEIATVKDYAAADHLKAELVLLGFSVSIAPIRQEGLQKYYVTVGPYDNKDGATIDLERLKQNKIRGKLKKLR